MKTSLVVFLFASVIFCNISVAFRSLTRSRRSAVLFSSNSDVFGGPTPEAPLEIKDELSTSRKNKFKEDAERLRKEAAELEIALR